MQFNNRSGYTAAETIYEPAYRLAGAGCLIPPQPIQDLGGIDCLRIHWARITGNAHPIRLRSKSGAPALLAGAQGFIERIGMQNPAKLVHTGGIRRQAIPGKHDAPPVVRTVYPGPQAGIRRAEVTQGL